MRIPIHTRLIFAALLLAAAATPLFALTYSVTDLGVLNDTVGNTTATVNAVNASGKIVGINASGGHYIGFIYGGARTNLGTLGGANSYAQGINASNIVCGSSTTSAGTDHAFRWTPGGTNGVAGNAQMFDLGTLGGNISDAEDINISGQIAGTASTDPSDTYFHACRFNPDGSIVDVHNYLPFNALSPFINSYGFAINQSGQVAGYATDYLNINSPQAFFFNGFNAVMIGDLASGGGGGGGGGGGSTVYSQPYAMNNNGTVVGIAATSNGEYHAFRWRQGVIADLGSLARGTNSEAWAVNSSGYIVGKSLIADGLTEHAFIVITNTMYDLNSLLDASGTGWTLIKAEYINDNGQIVGYGTNNGVLHGFFLNYTPPKITAIATSARTNALVSFTTMTGATYYLDARTNLLSGGWSNLLSGIAGTGATNTVTHTNGAISPARFYRVRLTVP